MLLIKEDPCHPETYYRELVQLNTDLEAKSASSQSYPGEGYSHRKHWALKKRANKDTEAGRQSRDLQKRHNWGDFQKKAWTLHLLNILLCFLL